MNITNSSDKSKYFAGNDSFSPVQPDKKTDASFASVGFSAGGLGRLTKFADKKSSVDPETGEVCFFEWVDSRDGSMVPRASYDQDASDLERWILKAAARKCLMKIEVRAKRYRLQYSKLIYCCDCLEYSDISTREVRRVWFLISAVMPVSFRIEDKMRRKSIERIRSEVWAMLKSGVSWEACDVDEWVVEECSKARFRVVNCGRDRIGASASAEIWHSKKSDRCSYHNVAVCGSVWTCPDCSRKINLKRQAHIAAAYELFVTSKLELSPGVHDGDAVMITMTVRHGIGDDLADKTIDVDGVSTVVPGLLSRLKMADRLFLQKSHVYKKLCGYTNTVKGKKYVNPSLYDYVGRVTATEINYGGNGWHPHVHGLWFFDRRLTDVEIVKIRRDLFAEWSRACVSAGLPPPLEYVGDRPVGVDARRCLSAAEYMTKFGDARQWSVEKELVSQHQKTAKRGRSAFQLLADYAQGDNDSGKLFQIFAEGTLGKHQLEFSKGLRARLVELGLDEILASDEELAASSEDDDVVMGALTDSDFDALLDADSQLSFEPFGLLLVMCKKNGFDAAIGWLRGLASYRPGVADRARGHLREARSEMVERSISRDDSLFWDSVAEVGGIPVLEAEHAVLQYEPDRKILARDLRSLTKEVLRSVDVRREFGDD